MTVACVLLLGCEHVGPAADPPRLVSPEPPELGELRSATAAHDDPPPQFAPIQPDLVGVARDEKSWFLSLTAEKRHLVRQICRARRNDPCAGMLPPPIEGEVPHDQSVRDLLAKLADENNLHVDEFCFQANGHEACVTPLVIAFEPTARIDLLPASERRFAFRPGRPMTSAWPTAVTPWIAMDRDGDGAITSGAELFGDSVANARDGFEALAQLDDNRDGVIDRDDGAFDKLLLWADANADRESTLDELRPLASIVSAIPLAHRGVRGSVHLLDGRVGVVEDLYLPAAQ